MSFFKRLFNIGSAEVHSAIDKIEDPVKMTEQGIRDLKSDLDKSLKGLAEVKAIEIRTRKEAEQQKALASDYENKAMMLLKRAQDGQVAPEEADRLASQALTKKEQALQQAANSQKMLQTHEASVAKMEQNVHRLKNQISTWENELKTLKARSKVSQATTKLNKQLANIDSGGTITMLERMKEKVDQQEALAESYGDLANTAKSVDEEIDQALLGSGSSSSSSSDSLLALKAKMGLNAPKEDSGSQGTNS
ncbi:PspA/IM30 family protein [Rapidithrix thailandica]|uniref:PspA/IM30 family protein n=1 Tax=Rapidithrix thailandica TaxID=413964 RepID=A0AAW9RYM1_9BACT